LNKSIELNPSYAQAYNNRANLHRKLFASESAISDYKKSLNIDPNFSEAISNYAGILRELFTSLEESISLYEKSLAISPENTVIYSNYLYALCHSENISTKDLFFKTKSFSKIVSESATWQKLESRAENHADLRIGFVSGDFYDHVVAQWFTPLFDAFLARNISIALYYNNILDDRITARYRQRASIFRDVSSLSDDDLVKLIHSDAIDVLVDLSGHSGKNRLSTFARKPTKLQLTWLGHPFTTGLEVFDYVVIASGSQSLPYYSDWVEKFMYIPGVVAFPPHTLPELGPAPSLKNGYITFGSLNRSSKCGLGVLETWAAIMSKVEDSRLIIADISLERKGTELLQFFQSRGVDPSRVTMRNRCVTLEFLKLHNQIDIALDTWPFSGGITASNCLHMGLPFVAMQGPTYASSVSAVMLRALGLEEWIATSPADYVDVAVRHANNIGALSVFRDEIPKRLQTDSQFSSQTVIDGFLRGVRQALSLRADGKTVKHIHV
jgi:predicted O-linked N-acetylglucosamine transferase (SPINDLY family)